MVRCKSGSGRQCCQLHHQGPRLPGHALGRCACMALCVWPHCLGQSMTACSGAGGSPLIRQHFCCTARPACCEPLAYAGPGAHAAEPLPFSRHSVPRQPRAMLLLRRRRHAHHIPGLRLQLPLSPPALHQRHGRHVRRQLGQLQPAGRCAAARPQRATCLAMNKPLLLPRWLPCCEHA